MKYVRWSVGTRLAVSSPTGSASGGRLWPWITTL